MAKQKQPKTKDQFKMKMAGLLNRPKAVGWAMFQDDNGDLWIKQPESEGGGYEVIPWPTKADAGLGGGRGP